MVDLSVDCAVDNDATRQPTDDATRPMQPTEVTTEQPEQDAIREAVQRAFTVPRFNWLHFVKLLKADLKREIVSETVSFTAMFIIYFGFFVVAPVAEIIIGSVHLHDCPAQSFIPRYLIIRGCLVLLSNIMSIADLINRLCCYRSPKNVFVARINEYIIWVVNAVFAIIWLVTGAMCVYGACSSVSTEEARAGDYCHSTFYPLAGAVITGGFVLAFFICLFQCEE